MLTCLAEVFSALNEINLFLQRRELNIMTAVEKLTAFREKLTMWTRRAKRGSFINFPCLEETDMEDTSLHPDFVATTDRGIGCR